MMRKRTIFIALALLALNLSAVRAEESTAMMLAEADSMTGMDHSKMNHESMQRTDQSGTAKESDHDISNMKSSDTMEHGSMSMQGGAAPANARSPDYSEGYDFGAIPRPVLAGILPVLPVNPCHRHVQWH